MSDNKFSISDLSFSYKKETHPTLSGLNYAFKGGDIVGLIGKNGSGKTTLLNCMSGFFKPTTGSILLNNIGLDKSRRDIAVIVDHFDMFEYLTIEDNISFFLEFYKKKYLNSELYKYLEKYELINYRKLYAFEASKGMLKKMQIIISLLLNPILLLGDEPINDVDENNQKHFFDDIKALSNKNSSIIIFSLHNLDIIKKHTNKIIEL